MAQGILIPEHHIFYQNTAPCARCCSGLQELWARFHLCVFHTWLSCTCTPPAMRCSHAHRWVSAAVLAHSKHLCSDLQRKWLLWASRAASARSGWSWSPARTQLKSTRPCQFLWWRKWSCEDTLLCLLATSTAPWDRQRDGQRDGQTDEWTDYWPLCAGLARPRHPCGILLLLLLLFQKKSHCK